MTDHSEHLSYLETRKQFHESRSDQMAKYDQAILWLSSGAIALTVTYLEKLKPAGKSDCFELLLLSWVMFFLSLGCVVASHYFGQKSWTEAIDQLDKSQGNPSHMWVQDSAGQVASKLNVSSGAFLLLGGLFFIWFAYSNLEFIKS